MSLAAATRSETTKQFTTSMWWLLAVVLAAYVALTAAALGFVFAADSTGALGTGGGPMPPADTLAPTIYSSATAIGYVFPLLIGTLIVTSEFRHRTLTATFLAVPRRGTVLWAKLAVGAVLGVIYGVVGVFSAVAPGAAFLAGYGLDTALTSPDTWALLGRMLIAFVLWVFIGIGVGALVRNQVGAVVGVLVFTQFVEPIVRLAAGFVDGLRDVVQYLPGAAGDALVGSSVFSFAGAATGDPLEWWAGGLVLAAYAAVLLFLGYLTTWRRDVS